MQPATIAYRTMRALVRAERARLAESQEVYPDCNRPRNRSECRGGPRPCPFVECRYHLYLDVNRNGSIKLNFPDLEVWQMEHSCVLDLADKGPISLEAVAHLLNVTREAIRLTEARAMRSVAKQAPQMALEIKS